MTGTLSFTPTAADLVAVYALHIQRGARRRWVLMALWGLVIGISMVMIEGIETMSDAAIRIAIYLSIALLIAGVFAVAVKTLWLPRWARRIYAQQKDLQLETTLRWDETGFTTTNASGNATSRWRDLHGWKRGDAALLLYRSDALFNFVPLHSASDQAAADVIVGHLAAANVRAC